MKMFDALLLPASVVSLVNCRLGVTRSRSSVLRIMRSSRSSAVNAVTETGVSCRLSSTRRAVVTISSSVARSSAASYAAAGPGAEMPSHSNGIDARNAKVFVLMINFPRIAAA